MSVAKGYFLCSSHGIIIIQVSTQRPYKITKDMAEQQQAIHDRIKYEPIEYRQFDNG